MENPEEILHSLEEFSKMKPKDIPRELEEYLCFVAKTGNPVYQWPIIKSLFREKLINVITEFYESCPSMDIPPCPNVEMFNYDMMKNFILEKLDTFAAAPFTVQRICELLTTPRKEYSRIDKYMRALEKNILVVSTVEPGRRSTENGEDGIMNGIETEHLPESSNSSHDINIEDMDESPSNWSRHDQVIPVLYKNVESENTSKNGLESVAEPTVNFENDQEEKAVSELPTSSTVEEPKQPPQETVITCTSTEQTIETYVSIDPQETSYQNLSDESNSNNSDSSSSTTISETKETTSSEEKEITEEVPEDKVDTIVPKEDQPETQTPVIVTETQPEAVETPDEDTRLELPQSTSLEEALPEKDKEDISTQEIVPDSQQPEVTSVSESSLETEEKIDTEEKEPEQIEPIEEKKEEVKVEEDQIIEPIPQPCEDVIDSSTDKKEEEENISEKSPKQVEVEKIETNDLEPDVETIKSDVSCSSKEQYEESPMEVDTNQEKKIETEEPSSSVEPFIV